MTKLTKKDNLKKVKKTDKESKKQVKTKPVSKRTLVQRALDFFIYGQ